VAADVSFVRSEEDYEVLVTFYFASLFIVVVVKWGSLRLRTPLLGVPFSPLLDF
jgi:hypothetical protein